MIIYKAVNKINGKVYVGQTVRPLRKRITDHLQQNSPIGRALRKYGLSSFIFSTLSTCCSKSEMDTKEKTWISFYNSKTPNGYNLADGGGGAIGYHHTEEAKRKCSIKNKGRKKPWLSERNRINRGEKHPNFGIRQTEESKYKRSISMLGKNAGINSGCLGKHWKWNDESRKNLSERMKGMGHHMFGKKRPEHSLRMMGENNPSKRPEVNIKRSKTITSWWKIRKENYAPSNS
jgi:group I intron endonuclease